ncbi:unnamed protein product, partial [Heterotrigona itama]
LLSVNTALPALSNRTDEICEKHCILRDCEISKR